MMQKRCKDSDAGSTEASSRNTRRKADDGSATKSSQMRDLESMEGTF